MRFKKVRGRLLEMEVMAISNLLESGGTLCGVALRSKHKEEREQQRSRPEVGATTSGFLRARF